jgi:predicted dinucleotide-utilizing enzyme
MTQSKTQAKTAIVFGGSRGIAPRRPADGANVALTYALASEKAAEVAGADVVVEVDHF